MFNDNEDGSAITADVKVPELIECESSPPYDAVIVTAFVEPAGAV